MQCREIIKATGIVLSKGTIKGKQKVPRYLYHLTTVDNYRNMIVDKRAKVSADALNESLQGLFLFDLKNFTKRWCHTGVTVGDKKFSLADLLITRVAAKSPEMVLLRIPTEKLNLDSLRCRLQDLTKKMTLKHAQEGDIATNQRHYTRKKSPIEYIYQDDVSIDDIEILGNANVIIPKDGNLPKVIDIFKGLLKGFPEEQCINIAKNNNSSFKEMPMWPTIVNVD